MNSMDDQKNESGLLAIAMNLIGFIRKYYIILILGILVGTAMGIKSWYQSKETAIAKLVISTSFIDNDVVAKLVNALQLYIETGNRAGLASKMGCDEEQLRTLGSLFADTTKAQMNAIKVDMGLSNTEEVDTVSAALINYLNNNPFIAEIIDLKARQREYLISRNESKISQIDSLLASGKISIQNFNDVAAISDNYMNLIREKQEAEYEGAVFSKIRIIEQNVTTLPKRGLKNALLINIIAFFFLSFILSALIDVIRIYLRRRKLARTTAQ